MNPEHCARACGWLLAATRWPPPLAANALNEIGTTVIPTTYASEPSRASMLGATGPSIELSIGTTPRSTTPVATAVTTSPLLFMGRCSQPGARARVAWCVNVPTGPR